MITDRIGERNSPIGAIPGDRYRRSVTIARGEVRSTRSRSESARAAREGRPATHDCQRKEKSMGQRRNNRVHWRRRERLLNRLSALGRRGRDGPTRALRAATMRLGRLGNPFAAAAFRRGGLGLAAATAFFRDCGRLARATGQRQRSGIHDQHHRCQQARQQAVNDGASHKNSEVAKGDASHPDDCPREREPSQVKSGALQPLGHRASPVTLMPYSSVGYIRVRKTRQPVMPGPKPGRRRDRTVAGPAALRRSLLSNARRVGL